MLRGCRWPAKSGGSPIACSSLQRQAQRDAQTALVTIGKPNSTTVRLDDLPHERKSQPGSSTLGGVERQQRLAQNGFTHAEPPVCHFNLLFFANMFDHQLDCLGRAA